MATLSINEYQRKRDFRRSREPEGEAPAVQAGHLYVMHKHAAWRLHYDLRMEQDGVLRSWALPKGAPLEKADKRLAIEVENHPLTYGSFEGNIPKGEYGGGTVMLWDMGMWQTEVTEESNVIDLMQVLKERLQGRGRQVSNHPASKPERSPRGEPRGR